MEIDGLNGFQGIRREYDDSERRNNEALDALGRIKSKAAGADADKQLEKLDTVTRDIESLFLYMLLKEMRKTVPETKLIHGGRAEEIFRDMLDEEISKKMAAAPGPGIGIAKMLYQELSRSIIGRAGSPQENGENSSGQE